MSTPGNRDARKLRPVDILSVKEGIRYLVRFLGGYSGTDIHWSAGKSSICPGGNDCRFPHAKYPPMWRGWAPVLHYDEALSLWFARALEVTGSLEEQMRGQLLRGQCWALHREPHKRKQGAVVGTFVDRVDLTTIPDAFELLPVLRRVYPGVNITLGKPNMTPGRTIIEAHAGPVPELIQEEVVADPPPPSAEQRRLIHELAQGKRVQLHSPNGNGQGNGQKGGTNGMVK